MTKEEENLIEVSKEFVEANQRLLFAVDMSTVDAKKRKMISFAFNEITNIKDDYKLVEQMLYEIPHNNKRIIEEFRRLTEESNQLAFKIEEILMPLSN